jgi:hypothetical protein
MDEEGEFYLLWTACEATPVWVPSAFMEPNFDEVWRGAPLPKNAR